MTFRKPFTIKRSVPGQYDDDSGLWVPGAVSEIEIKASVQPVAGEGGELNVNLPEGKRTQDTVRVYTDTLIFEAQEKTGVEGDRLLYLGHEFECVAVEEWQSGVISHYKGYFVKVS